MCICLIILKETFSAKKKIANMIIWSSLGMKYEGVYNAMSVEKMKEWRRKKVCKVILELNTKKYKYVLLCMYVWARVGEENSLKKWFGKEGLYIYMNVIFGTLCTWELQICDRMMIRCGWIFYTWRDSDHWHIINK